MERSSAVRASGALARTRGALGRRGNWLQLARFCAVGASGYVVNLAVFTALVHWAGLHYLLAAVCSFLVAVTNNYVWNRLWTFRGQRGHVAYQGARFLVVSVNGAGSGAQSRRDGIVRRIADFLDGGRGEVDGERPVSRCTAEIAAGAVYGTMMTKVDAGSVERGEEFLPELIYLATMPYLGARAAEDELAVQPLR